MTKKRKQHQLKGTIKYCWPGQVKSKSRYQGQNFYCLDVTLVSLFRGKEKTNLYAFPNLVSEDLWKSLEQQSFKNKIYLFFCEKRTRGWRLKEWEEITEKESKI